MTKIKLCGLSRNEDIQAANALLPDYIGFVFVPGSKRCLTPESAVRLRKLLMPQIQAVGVFVNEEPEAVARLLNEGVIDIAQLHGTEDETYLRRLRQNTDRKLIQAFQIRTKEDLMRAELSTADEILLDAGAGSGTVFNWALLGCFGRRYFLAGGLTPENAAEAVRSLHPYAVDVSSGIETGGIKDPIKMAAFVTAVRKENGT